MSQGRHIFVVFIAHPPHQSCLNYKSRAALTHALKKEWDEITPDKVRDICAAAPCRIMAVVQNGAGYIELFFCPFTANL